MGRARMRDLWTPAQPLRFLSHSSHAASAGAIDCCRSSGGGRRGQSRARHVCSASPVRRARVGALAGTGCFFRTATPSRRALVIDWEGRVEQDEGTAPHSTTRHLSCITAETRHRNNGRSLPGKVCYEDAQYSRFGRLGAWRRGSVLECSCPRTKRGGPVATVATRASRGRTHASRGRTRACGPRAGGRR